MKAADKKRLLKALKAVGAKQYHARMAMILESVHSIDYAINFVYGLQKRGLTPKPAKSAPLEQE